MLFEFDCKFWIIFHRPPKHLEDLKKSCLPKYQQKMWTIHRIFFWWSRVNDLTCLFCFCVFFLCVCVFVCVFCCRLELQANTSPWLLVLCQDSTQPFPSRAMGRIHLLSRCVWICVCFSASVSGWVSVSLFPDVCVFVCMSVSHYSSLQFSYYPCLMIII